MKIEITQEDIDKGRMEASQNCGCPIWCAVVRQLQIPESQAKELVSLPDYETLKLGDTEFALPKEAISLQRILVEYPLAHLEPCAFDAPVRNYEIKETEAEEVPEVEKPSLLARIFS